MSHHHTDSTHTTVTDELEALWVEAGRPVCPGIRSWRGILVASLAPDPDYVDIDEGLFGDDLPRHPVSRLVRVDDWGPPNFDAPETEFLLMRCAEAKLGRKLGWSWIPSEGIWAWIQSKGHWAIDRGPDWVEDDDRSWVLFETGDTRTVLALRIIIEANKQLKGEA